MSIIDFSAIIGFLAEYGLIIVLLVALLLALVYVAVRIGYHLGELRRVESKYFDNDTIDLIESVLKSVMAVSIALFMLFIATGYNGWLEENVWSPVMKYFPMAFTVAIIILVAVFLVKVQRRLIQYILASYKDDKNKDVRTRTLTITGLVLKYVIYGTAAVLCALYLAAQIPEVGDHMSGGAMDFIAANSNILGFIVLLVVVAYFANKFVQTFIVDYAKGSGSKLRPELANLAGKAVGWGIYAFAAFLILFSLLTIANLGQIGQIMLILGTTFIGLVVAFAATGSIGNILSGIVLMTFKPFDDGDLVILRDDFTCDIAEQGLLFTKVRTLQNELVDIPNNEITGGKIDNLTKSGSFAVKLSVSIGYDQKSEDVQRLLVEAAMKTSGILEDPKSQAFATSLGNNYITYDLYAYTNKAKELRRTRSDLITNVQKTFDEAKAEILSPEWRAVRMDAQKGADR